MMSEHGFPTKRTTGIKSHWIYLRDIAQIIALGLASGLSVALVLLLRRLACHRSSLWRRGIDEGLPARAKVIKIWDTGVTLNDDPQVGISLEVYPPEHHPPYRLETKWIVPRERAGLLRPGVEVPVRLNSESPAEVVLLE